MKFKFVDFYDVNQNFMVSDETYTTKWAYDGTAKLTLLCVRKICFNFIAIVNIFRKNRIKMCQYIIFILTKSLPSPQIYTNTYL